MHKRASVALNLVWIRLYYKQPHLDKQCLPSSLSSLPILYSLDETCFENCSRRFCCLLFDVLRLYNMGLEGCIETDGGFVLV